MIIFLTYFLYCLETLCLCDLLSNHLLFRSSPQLTFGRWPFWGLPVQILAIKQASFVCQRKVPGESLNSFIQLITHVIFVTRERLFHWFQSYPSNNVMSSFSTESGYPWSRDCRMHSLISGFDAVFYLEGRRDLCRVIPRTHISDVITGTCDACWPDGSTWWLLFMPRIGIYYMSAKIFLWWKSHMCIIKLRRPNSTWNKWEFCHIFLIAHETLCAHWTYWTASALAVKSCRPERKVSCSLLFTRPQMSSFVVDWMMVSALYCVFDVLCKSAYLLATHVRDCCCMCFVT